MFNWFTDLLLWMFIVECLFGNVVKCFDAWWIYSNWEKLDKFSSEIGGIEVVGEKRVRMSSNTIIKICMYICNVDIKKSQKVFKTKNNNKRETAMSKISSAAPHTQTHLPLAISPVTVAFACSFEHLIYFRPLVGIFDIVLFELRSRTNTARWYMDH